MKLKNLGVYSLPDGSELVVEMVHGHHFRLCSKKAWNHGSIVKYQINPDGSLLSKGVPTNWRVEHLVDTGLRVKYHKSSRVL